jgi:hypothetical protein
MKALLPIKQTALRPFLTILLSGLACEVHAVTVPPSTASGAARVVRVRYQPISACLGVDDTINPVAIMAPIGGTNSAAATITPPSQATRVRFDSANTGVATVNPTAAASPFQLLQIGGVSHLETTIRARTDTSGVLRSLTASAKPRRDRTLVIHAITEQNDDLQVVPTGQGEANQPCIGPGADGAINTAATSDDALTGTTSIHTGPNGICNSAASGDDIQIVPIGQGRPNRPCVGPGPNGFRDTGPPAGDDLVAGDTIGTGANGICQTGANATNLAPTAVPTAASLQTFLNAVWGRQANIFFTVTRTDAVLNYDLNRDGQLADPPDFVSFDEVDVLRTGAADAGADYNVYYVRVYSHPFAFADEGRHEAWVGDAKNGTTDYVTAHEVGHLLGRVTPVHSNDPLDLMFRGDDGTSPCEVRRTDWNMVNP